MMASLGLHEQYPGSSDTQLNDVVGSQFVGDYYDGSHRHGLLYDGATWHSLDYPGSNQTLAYGTDGTKVVGAYGPIGGSTGFVYDGVNWSPLTYPGASSTRRATSAARRSWAGT